MAEADATSLNLCEVLILDKWSLARGHLLAVKRQETKEIVQQNVKGKMADA